MKRLWEIDFLRGIAIVMMITFHIMFNINYLGIASINVTSGFWFFFARITASIFIVLVGVSLTLSYARANDKTFAKYLKRGVKIFSFGLVITLVTWIFVPNCFIVFGILHFIGLSIILAYFFLRFRLLNLYLGTAVMAAGVYLRSFVFSFPYLLWLGFLPSSFCSLDYFPLLPWFSLILIGIFFGNSFYAEKQRIRTISNPLVNFFAFLGKHSLVIYMLHQPVILAVLYLLL